jgi:hypothetical protein
MTIDPGPPHAGGCAHAQGDPKVAIQGLKGVMRRKVKAAPRSPEKAFPFTL